MEGTSLSAAKGTSSKGGTPSETASFGVSSVVASTVRALSRSGAAARSRPRVHRIVVPAGRMAGRARIRRRSARYFRTTARRRHHRGSVLAPAPRPSATRAAGCPPFDRARLPGAKGSARWFRDPCSENGDRRVPLGRCLPGSRRPNLRRRGGPVAGAHDEASSERSRAALISAYSGTGCSRPATPGPPAQ